jgi:hypothetical protein
MIIDIFQIPLSQKSILNSIPNRQLIPFPRKEMINGKALEMYEMINYHATRLGLKKYLIINSSNSSRVTFPLRFLSIICTYDAISVAVG